jgi:hypothetical protein
MISCKHALAIASLVFSSAAALRADYALSLSSDGAAQKTVSPGDTFTLDAVLTSNGEDSLNSAIFQVQFSQPGLIYQGYAWSAPFGNQTSDDDSKPLWSQLPLQLQASSLQGGGYPADTVDIELSNVIDSQDHFLSGKLVQLAFEVPLDHPAGSLLFSPVPDTFAQGFNIIPSTAGSSFQLTIVPEPNLFGLAFLTALAFLGIHRQNRKR